MSQSVKNPPAMQETACNAEDPSSNPGSGRSSGKENGYPLLAWETPWTEEPGGLQYMGSQELDTTS